MASIAEGVDDPSGNQRGAAASANPELPGAKWRSGRPAPAGDSARHNDAAPRLEPSRPPGGRGAATQVLAQVDEPREHDIEADVVVGPFGEYLLVDACPVGSIRKVIATGRTTPANPEGANR
jgi:hypothetical protein